MKIKPAIRTEKEIEQIVAWVGGTWVKQRNARKRLTEWSNALLDEEIKLQRSMIRKSRAEGAREGDLRCHFAKITKLEMQKL